MAELYALLASLGLATNGERGNSGNLDLTLTAESQAATLQSQGQGLTGATVFPFWRDPRVLSTRLGSRKQVGPNAGVGAYSQTSNIGSINNQNSVNDQNAAAARTGIGGLTSSSVGRTGAIAFQTNAQAQTSTTNSITPTYQVGSNTATNTITALGGGGLAGGATGGLFGGGSGLLGGLLGLGAGAGLSGLSGTGVPFVANLGGSLQAVTSEAEVVGRGVRCEAQFAGADSCGSRGGFLPSSRASGTPVASVTVF